MLCSEVILSCNNVWMLSNSGYPLPDEHVVIVVTVRMIVEIGSVRFKFIKFHNFY